MTSHDEQGSASTCPSCGGPNDCAMARGSGSAAECWCRNARVSRATLAALPRASANACICAQCASSAHETWPTLGSVAAARLERARRDH